MERRETEREANAKKIFCVLGFFFLVISECNAIHFQFSMNAARIKTHHRLRIWNRSQNHFLCNGSVLFILLYSPTHTQPARLRFPISNAINLKSAGEIKNTQKYQKREKKEKHVKRVRFHPSTSLEIGNNFRSTSFKCRQCDERFEIKMCNLLIQRN